MMRFYNYLKRFRKVGKRKKRVLPFYLMIEPVFNPHKMFHVDFLDQIRLWVLQQQPATYCKRFIFWFNKTVSIWAWNMLASTKKKVNLFNYFICIYCNSISFFFLYKCHHCLMLGGNFSISPRMHSILSWYDLRSFSITTPGGRV